MKKIPTSLLTTGLAMRSCLLPGTGRVSELIVPPGKTVYDPRRVRSLLVALARHYAVDLVALRKRCSDLLHRHNYLPIPFAPDLLLVPLPLGEGTELQGYINYLSVKDIQEMDKSSTIKLDYGVELPCRWSAHVVRERLVNAHLVLREMGTSGDVQWRQKLDLVRMILEDK